MRYCTNITFRVNLWECCRDVRGWQNWRVNQSTTYPLMKPLHTHQAERHKYGHWQQAPPFTWRKLPLPDKYLFCVLGAVLAFESQKSQRGFYARHEGITNCLLHSLRLTSIENVWKCSRKCHDKQAIGWKCHWKLLCCVLFSQICHH